MILLKFFTGTESANQVLFVLAGALLLFAIFVFYFTMIKPHQDEKREAKRQGAGTKDIAPPEPGMYDDIVDDYPTYHRQDGVK